MDRPKSYLRNATDQSVEKKGSLKDEALGRN
jgi:hypothetical protein